MRPSPRQFLWPAVAAVSLEGCVLSAASLPIDLDSPSAAGAWIARQRGMLRKSVDGCYLDYEFEGFRKTADGFAPDRDGPYRAVLSATSSIHGLWYPSARTRETRLLLDGPIAGEAERRSLRSTAVDRFIGKRQMPTSPRKIEELRDHDVTEVTILRDGLFRNAASLASLGLFLFSTALVTRRTYRALRLPKGYCPHCRYNLHGLPPDSPCPECGRPRTN